MKTASAVVITALIMLFPVDGWAGTHRRTPHPSAQVDPQYVLALATANRFLGAWRTGDLETGAVLLSDHVRHTQSAETLEQFFSAGSERAFEILPGSGRKGHYRFSVVLVSRQVNTTRRVPGEIILVNTGKEDWVVDKLP